MEKIKPHGEELAASEAWQLLAQARNIQRTKNYSYCIEQACTD